jgi:uncharacterized protein YdaU (DUF1376 family)
MHYYQHHIGDFIKATARLTDTQCMTYLRLLWMYYDTEKPLEQDIDTLAFQLGVNPKDVGMILNAYFKLDNDAWHHTRCDEEISKFHLKSDRAKTANKIRWGSKMDEKSDPVQIATNNHKPITNIKETKTTTLTRPDDVSEELWVEFKQHRKTKKASITERVIKTLRSEGAKANLTLSEVMEKMIVKGWTGFEAAWAKPNETKSTDWWMNDRRIK